MISDSTKYCWIPKIHTTEEKEDDISEMFCVFEVATGQSNLTSNYKINLKYMLWILFIGPFNNKNLSLTFVFLLQSFIVLTA